MPKRLTRLTEPLVRENGALRPASWDEALGRAADGFRAAVAAGGGPAVRLFIKYKYKNNY
jgi:predicted molibdopterin-dependent oxidoreductase YjgC